MAAVALDSWQLRRRWRGDSWVWAALLSAIGHALFVCLFLAMSALSLRMRERVPKPQQVSLRALDASRWQFNRGNAAPAPPPRKDSQAPLYPMPPGQIVDTASGNNQVAPDAKYLAETSNRVRKQTRAREQISKYGRAAPKNLASAQAPPAELKGGGEPKGQPMADQELQHWLRQGELGPRRPNLFQLGQAQPTPDESAQGPGTEAGDASERSTGPESAAAGGGSPNDDLSGVEEGDGTFLNTREWKFAGFFNRVKQAVSGHWDPNGRLRSKDPNGRRFGGLERTTFVNVTLRPDGTIADIFVARSSGLDFLDAEAVQAFYAAQPFSNPLAGLIQDGYIRFAFGFNVMHDNGVHLFRMPH